LPGFLDQLLAPPNERNAALAKYYSERADEMQRKIADHWRDGTIRQTPFAQQTIIQVFYTADGAHREEDSVYARVGQEEWKEVRIELPPGAGAAPLRIDFVSALTTIDIASIRLRKAGSIYLSAPEEAGFDSVRVSGDAERLAHPRVLRLKISGIDPQLYLPVVALPSSPEPLVLELRLQVLALPPSTPAERSGTGSS
jgi:hypothetical protein